MLKTYGKTPEDWLPDKWMQGYNVQEEEPLITEAPQMAGQMGGQGGQEQLTSEQVGEVGQEPVTLPQNPASLASKLTSQMTNKMTGR